MNDFTAGERLWRKVFAFNTIWSGFKGVTCLCLNDFQAGIISFCKRKAARFVSLSYCPEFEYPQNFPGSQFTFNSDISPFN